MPHYGSEAGLTSYAASVGMEVPAGSLLSALTRASMWLDGRYGLQFPGVRSGGYAQALAWPRTGATTSEGLEVPAGVVPAGIEFATYEAALRHLATPGSLAPDFMPNSQIVKEKVDTIEIQYADTSKGGAAAAAPVFTIIDDLVRPYLIRRQPAILVV